MLNAYAKPFYPFYPITVENSRDGDMKEKPNGRKNKKGLKKQSEVTKPTDIETRSEETIKPVLQQREEVINKQSTEEWKKVESKKKKKTVTNNKEERNKTQNKKKYWYNILAEDDEDEEEKESDIKQHNVEKINLNQQKHYEIYNINDMLVEDVDRVLAKYKDREQGQEKDFDYENSSNGLSDDEMTADEETENESDAEEELKEDNESDENMNEVVDDKKNTNENEESLSAEEEQNFTMRQLLYQNDLLLFQLEKAETSEEVLRKEISLVRNTIKNETNKEVNSLKKQLQEKEDEQRVKAVEYETKLKTAEKALKAKTEQLLGQLR